MNPTSSLSSAATFIGRTARLIDRFRFACLFLDGDCQAVLSALRAYQNPDGGFGNALEPDLRDPGSQPAAVLSALEVLDEVGGFGDSMVQRACDYLLTITRPGGGVPFVLPSARGYPHAPWWEPEADPPASLLTTAGIAALLLKHRVEHPWLAKAAAFCWQKIDALQASNPYEMRSVFPFLEHAPDQARAQAAFARVAPKIFEQDLVALDPAATGPVHSPLNFAPRPESLARPLFSDAVIQAHLQALAQGQGADGGWTFNWMEWNPATTLEWRAWVTIDALKTLRAYGRV